MSVIEIDEVMYGLSPDDVKLLVNSLRAQEKHARKGFAHWIARNLNLSKNAEIMDRVAKSMQVIDQYQRLREKLGDTKPVDMD